MADSVTDAADRLLKSFKRPATLLIAVSGGSDSTGLLVALATLCATGRYPQITLRASTVDHALRAVLERLPVAYVDEAELLAADPGLHSFFDLDTPQDLAAASLLVRQ